MKKKTTLISLLLLPLLGACSWSNYFSIDTSSESSSEKASFSYISYVDQNTYHIGDSYSLKSDITVNYVYSDGTYDTLSDCSLSSLGTISDPFGNKYTAKTAFTIGGWYTSTNAKVKTNDGYTFTDCELSFYVNSGLEDNYDMTSLSISFDTTFTVGSFLADNLSSLYLNAEWRDHGNETISYEAHEDKFSLNLYEESDLTTDVQNEALKKDTNYTLEVSYYNLKATSNILVTSGVRKIDSSNLTIKAKDVNNNYAPSTGKVKMLVIPITLPDEECTSEWSNAKTELLNTLYFASDGSVLSLKEYYETVSFNQMNVSGLVADIYQETDHTYDVLNLQADESYSLLFDLIKRAVTYIEENNPSIDWSEFDNNNDGCLDNVHLITNFNTGDYGRKYGDVWSTTLWPHMYQTGDNSGTHDKPVANVYSISAIDHVGSAITAIHEQGHIFGLNDYYDYSYSGADYVGELDMQDQNCFDWNSYSKLVTGWVSPYVIDGSEDEVTVTINAASATGDCIIIPADYSTWNGSAYDEYFLIELFSNTGINTLWWDQYNLNAGIRLYHVDSRLWDYDDNKEVDTINGNHCDVGANNCYNYEDYDLGCEEWKDHPLLSLVQQGGTNTFASGKRTRLSNSDLFRSGNTFTFDKYSHFLNKQGEKQDTMDNGETFPYTINFISVSSTSATISFTKTK